MLVGDEAPAGAGRGAAGFGVGPPDRFEEGPIDEPEKKFPEKKKAEFLQKLQQEIVLVEAEAEEFGLTPPKDEHDDPPLLNGFRDGPEKDFLREEIIKWSTAQR